MHERRVMEDFMNRIESVARAEGATRVTAVHVRLGVLSHMTPDHFLEHFRDSSRGSVAEGAEVRVEMIPDLTDPLACELVLESVEVETA